MEPVWRGVHLGIAGLDREHCIGREAARGRKRTQSHLCKMMELRVRQVKKLGGAVKIFGARHDR